MPAMWWEISNGTCKDIFRTSIEHLMKSTELKTSKRERLELLRKVEQSKPSFSKWFSSPNYSLSDGSAGDRKEGKAVQTGKDGATTRQQTSPAGNVMTSIQLKQIQLPVMSQMTALLCRYVNSDGFILKGQTWGQDICEAVVSTDGVILYERSTEGLCEHTSKVTGLKAADISLHLALRRNELSNTPFLL